MTSRGATFAGFLLAALLVLPVFGLGVATSPADLIAALGSTEARAALALSLATTTAALAVTMALGTPLAWWLSREHHPWTGPVGIAVELPVVLPPAVLGVALLESFGRNGLVGAPLAALGLQIGFTPLAVVLAQVLVGAPLYVLTAATAFRAVDDDTLLVARTLGATPAQVFARVALPMALPGLLAGAALAWARALGEFGATLMFAGNLPGRTQTLPLAIFQALEGDMAAARALSVLLVGVALAILVALRWLGNRGHA